MLPWHADVHMASTKRPTPPPLALPLPPRRANALLVGQCLGGALWG